MLGGTGWLGGVFAAAAVAAGHDVTCLARGAGVPAGARLVRANRDFDDALSPVAGEQWDLVFDVSRTPGHVRRSVRALADAGRYVFVSTVSVYASHREHGQDEDAAALEALPRHVDAGEYGPAKAACEAAVRAGFGDRSLVLRAGLIGGPGDPTARTRYWPWRLAHTSNDARGVLLPDALDDPVSIVDVRDLADFALAAGTGGLGGVLNVAGTPMPLGAYIEDAVRAAEFEGTLFLAPAAWLAEHEVSPWVGERSLPLWLGDPDWLGLATHSNARALAAGLRLRAPVETIRDALAVEDGQPAGAGLADRDERALLAALRAG